MTKYARPRLPHTLRTFAATCAVLLLAGCSAQGGYNPTTASNVFNEEVLKASNIRNVVIADVNLGSPSRNYVSKAEQMIDGRVAAYLRSNGYNILPQREFSQRWQNATLIYGNPIDPTTGRVNTKTFIQLIATVRDQMKERTDVDAFVFTDLVETEIVITDGINRVARFDGVSRKPTLKGAGQGVSTEFDWNQAVAAISIQVAVYNTELDQVFAGLGGIDLTDAIDTRSGRGFVRRKDVLENEDFIDEGIKLAFHPMIRMKDWPGKTMAPEKTSTSGE